MEKVLRLKPVKFIWYTVVSTIVLTFIIYGFTDFQINSWRSLFSAVLLIELFQVLMQPVFNLIAKIFGLMGILVTGFFGYATVFWLSFTITPEIEGVTFWSCVIAAWVYAILVVIIQWVFMAQSDDFFLERAVRSQDKTKSKQQTPGFVFVQLDGVSSELLEWQLVTGNLPNIRKLIEHGGYKFERWKTQIPSTTPASQAGILLGSNDDIPAFRWYDRKLNMMVVANQANGAALIEKRLSSGKGLLCDGGVSIGNLFSGDAKQNIMVMSKLGNDRQSLHAMREYTDYFSSLYGFMRAIVLSVGEIIKEFRQARQQNKRNIHPRVTRKLSYVMLRAATNVLLRDLQTRIVIEKMLEGVNSLYVDYLDYDEIAHHAGISRPESLDALVGLDRVIGVLTKASELTQRPYNIVIVSDHGQSQGPTFKQLNDGVSLEQYLSGMLSTDKIKADTEPVESKSVTRTLSFGKGTIAKSLNGKPNETAEIIVTGSGNVGNIWFKQYKNRATLETLEKDYPELLKKLLSTNGVGFVIVDSKKDGPICLSKTGKLILKKNTASGTNPLIKYSGIRSKDILKLAVMNDAADIQIFSDINERTGEVYAFEELVGNHGGIGGWQADAILLYPEHLKINKKHYDRGIIYDSTTIHKIFKEWLR